MVFDNVANLVSQELSVNEAGDSIAKESWRVVFCAEKSLGLKRRIEAEQLGLKASIKLVLADVAEYKGEEIVVYNSQRYNVVDVYKAENNTVELTLGVF